MENDSPKQALYVLSRILSLEGFYSRPSRTNEFTFTVRGKKVQAGFTTNLRRVSVSRSGFTSLPWQSAKLKMAIIRAI